MLGFVVFIEFEGGFVAIHPETQFVIGIHAPEGAIGETFSELNTGLDHFSFAVDSKDDLVEWETLFEERDVEYTPILEMELGWHLNFRDPDRIPHELFTPNEDALRQMAEFSGGRS